MRDFELICAISVEIPLCGFSRALRPARAPPRAGRHPTAMDAAPQPQFLPQLRGGLHQRKRQRAAADGGANLAQNPAQNSVGNLAHSLLQMWAWGSLSAKTLQKLAADAVRDGCPDSSLHKLAKLGSAGTCAGNCHRDLLEFLRRAGLPAPPRAVKQPVPLRLRTAVTATSVDLPYMPLHRVFAHMYTHWPTEWTESVKGQAGELEAWWRELDKARDPRWQAWRDALMEKSAATGIGMREMLAQTIPLALHADGVRV